MARSAGPLVTKGGMSPLSRRVQFSLLTLPLPLPALLLSPFDSLLPHLASLGETLRRRTTEVEGPRQYWDPQPTSEGSWGPFLVTEPQPEAGCPYTECSPLSTAAPSSPHPAHRPSCPSVLGAWVVLFLLSQMLERGAGTTSTVGLSQGTCELGSGRSSQRNSGS